MTEFDYPAAHSMDATWFAVDAAGRVAAFETGENGHLPDGAFTDYGDDLLEQWHSAPDGVYDRDGQLSTAGFYYYYYDYDWIGQTGLYHRRGVPVNPVHVDQLPPALRAGIARTRFAGVDFAKAAVVQPCEQFHCRFWGGRSAYLAADGTTVRPISGSEPAYWSHFADVLGDLTGEAARYRFEGVEVTPERITVRSIPGDPKAFWDFYARLSRERPVDAARFHFELPADQSDYPAAHSMDTHWYSVDAAGRVALFMTGENGHLPVHAQNAHLLGRLLGDLDPDAGDDFLSESHLAPLLGFYLYEYADNYLPIDIYDRRVVPTRPTHVDQLPPDVRAVCKTVRLPIVFAEAQRVQPVAFFQCTMWGAYKRVAFLDADGVTLRPMPGKEHELPAFEREIRAEWGDQFPYRFEGIDDGR